MKPITSAAVPLEAQYLFRRGRDMMDQQKEDVALIYLRQAVFIAPGFSKAYRELGTCLTRLGREEEASVYRQKACRIDPVNNGGAADGATLKKRREENPVQGAALAFLVW